jgi:hypothetical protein
MVEIDVRTQDQVKLIKLRGKLHLDRRSIAPTRPSRTC